MDQRSKSSKPQQVKYYTNCLFWALWQKFKYGGKINYHRSGTWKGFHVSWTNANGEIWEYTAPTQNKRDWWYLPILFRGVVRRRPNERKNS